MPFYNVLDTFGPWLQVTPATCLISTRATPRRFATALRARLSTKEPFSLEKLSDARLHELPDSAWTWIARQRRRELQRRVPHALDPLCRACVFLYCERCAHRASLLD